MLAVGQIRPVADFPSELEPPSSLKADELALRGGSAVIGPDGEYITEPVFDEESLIVAEIDTEAIDREAMTLDVSGHYSRPDIFRFEVRDR